MTTNVFCGSGDRGRTRCSSQTTPFYLKAEKAALGLGQCEYSASRDIISRFRRVTKGRPRFLDGHWVSAAAFPGTPALSPGARCSRARCVPASTHARRCRCRSYRNLRRGVPCRPAPAWAACRAPGGPAAVPLARRLLSPSPPSVGPPTPIMLIRLTHEKLRF